MEEGLVLGLWFCSLGLHVCFCDSTMLFLWLWLSGIIRNQILWCILRCSFCSIVCLLSGAFCAPIWILGLFFHYFCSVRNVFGILMGISTLLGHEYWKSFHFLIFFPFSYCSKIFIIESFCLHAYIFSLSTFETAVNGLFSWFSWHIHSWYSKNAHVACWFCIQWHFCSAYQVWELLGGASKPLIYRLLSSTNRDNMTSIIWISFSCTIALAIYYSFLFLQVL